MSNETLNLASDAKVSGRLETNEFKLTDDDKRQIFDISNITANTERICVFPDADSRVPANNSTSITTNLSVPVGANNTFYGIGAGSDVTTGTDNIIVGYDATAGTSSAVGRIVLGIEGKYNNCFHLPSNTMYLPNLANNIFSNVVYYDTVTKTIAYGLGGGGGGGGSSNMPDGTALIPGLKFENEQSTGFFRGGAGQFSISVGGTERIQFNGYQIETTQQTSPTYSFLSANTSGMGFNSSTLKFYNTVEQLSLGTTSNFFTKGVFISHSNNTNKDVYDGTTFSQVFAVGADTDNGLGNYKMGFSFDTSGSNLNFNYLQTAQNVRMGFIRSIATSTTQGSEVGQLSFYVKPAASAALEILRLNSNVDARVPIYLQSGTAATPSLTFSSDTDTGFYSIGSNQLGIAVGGAQSAAFSTSQALFLSGTVSAPSISFAGDTDTGIYNTGNAVNFTTAGVNRMFLDTIRIRTSLPFEILNSSSIAPALWVDATNAAYAANLALFETTRAAALTFNFMCCRANSVNMAFLTGLGNWQMSAGAEATPSYSFVNDTNTGMFSSASDVLDFSTGGTSRMQITTSSVIFNVAATFNSGFTLGAGSATVPTYSFSTDPNTGMYSGGADVLNFSTGGTSRLSISTSGLTSTLQIIGPDGSAATPGFRCTSEATGFSVPSAGTLAFSVAGSSQVNINNTRFATGLPIYITDGTAGIPSYTFTSDTGTGLYLASANTLGIAAGGVSAMTINTSSATINNPLTATSFNISSPGDVTTPGFAFRSGTGFYEDTKINVINIASNGVNTVKFGPSSVIIYNPALATSFTANSVGSISSPAFKVGNYGLYVDGKTNNFIISNVDSVMAFFYSSGAQINGILYSDNLRFKDNGTASTPFLSSFYNPTTGLYNPTTDTLGITANGTQVTTFDTTGIHITNDGSSAVPSLSFTNDTNTGIYRSSADVLGITVGGFPYVFGNGYFCQGNDAQANLGLGTNRWLAVYAQNGTIQTSDQNDKKDIENSPLGIDFVNKLTPRRYRWNNGTSGRFHYGLVAQELKAVLDESKIDTRDFAGFVDSSITEAPDKAPQLGLNYTDIVTVLIQSIKDLSAKLDTAISRINVLEGN